MSRIKPVRLACFVLGVMVLCAVPAAAQETDAAALEKRVQALETKISNLEKMLQQRLANIERRLASAQQPPNPLEGEAQQEYAKISRLAAEGKMGQAKTDMASFMKKYASTATAQNKRTQALNQELAVVGKDAPADWGGIEKWYQGESEIDLAGNKPTLLVFWESWCPHCQREVPKVQALADALKDDGLQVVALTKITRSSTEEKVQTFITEKKVGYPMAKEDGSISRYFNVSGIPAAAMLKDGKVIWRGHPARLNEQLIKSWL
jgi:thiol-disulfide isomerase/thioredoxin